MKHDLEMQENTIDMIRSNLHFSNNKTQALTWCEGYETYTCKGGVTYRYAMHIALFYDASFTYAKSVDFLLRRINALRVILCKFQMTT